MDIFTGHKIVLVALNADGSKLNFVHATIPIPGIQEMVDCCKAQDELKKVRDEQLKTKSKKKK